MHPKVTIPISSYSQIIIVYRVQALCLVFIRGVTPTAEMVHLKQEERFLMAWVVRK
jgi:hypothetical protein